MPRKIENTTKAHLISVPLPQHGTSYTVISHQFIIDYAYQSLANAGFAVVSEEYRCTADGQIAQGVYKLNFNNDPELSMMFAWTNSYNKQVKFKCLVGAYINNTGGVMISGEVGTWVRKHMGAADTETKGIIDDYISNAHMYYNQLVADKNAMEYVVLNTRKQAQLLGVLFAEYGILTTEQASMVRDQMKKPSFAFENSDSLWAFYNYVTIALQQSHPKTWMEDQRILHYFISTIIKSAPVPVQIEEPVEEVVDPLYEVPNQTNILDQIDEINAFSMAQLAGVKAPEDLTVDQAQYPITLADVIEEEHREPEPKEYAVSTDEVIQYQDPVGNTFEAPIVEEKSFNDVLGEAIIAKANFIEAETPKSEFAEEDNFSLDEDLPSLAINEVLEDVVNLNVLPVAEVKEDDDFNFDLDFNESGDDDTPDFF